MVKTQMAVGVQIASSLNSPKFQKYSKKAFSIAEALIALLIGGLILGMSAPLITKQLKHNSFTDIQAQLLNRKVENAKDDIVSNTNTIASILGGRDVATYVQYIQTLENKISVLENAMRNENIQNILNGKTELKDYDNDITGLQTQINSKASTSSVDTINTNLNNLEDDVTEIEKNMKNLVPPGTVMYFDLGACPKGWTPLSAIYPSASGSFIRNIGETNRKLGSYQSSAVPNIELLLRVDGYYASNNGIYSSCYLTKYGNEDTFGGAMYYGTINSDEVVCDMSSGNEKNRAGDLLKTAPEVYDKNVKEVRPNNIALLACRKD